MRLFLFLICIFGINFLLKRRDVILLILNHLITLLWSSIHILLQGFNIIMQFLLFCHPVILFLRKIINLGLRGCQFRLGFCQGGLRAATLRLPWIGNAYTALELRILISGDKGRLRTHFPDHRHGVYRWDEALHAIFVFIRRYSVNLHRSFSCVFIVNLGAVFLIIAVPCLFRYLLYLNHYIVIGQALYGNLLTQSYINIVGTHVDADNLALLGLLVFKDVVIVVDGCPTRCYLRSKLNNLVTFDLLCFAIHRIYERFILVLIKAVCLIVRQISLNAMIHNNSNGQ